MRLLLIVLTAAVALGGCKGDGDAAGSGVKMTRNATIGARYGSAGPRTCQASAPADGAITTAQAAAYVICGQEGEQVDRLSLVSDVAITEVSSPWKFDGISHDAVPGIDVTKPVQSIKGRMTVFECNRLLETDEHGPLYKKGSNCWKTEHKDANGLCYRTVEGGWSCVFDDPNAMPGEMKGLPPPA